MFAFLIAHSAEKRKSDASTPRIVVRHSRHIEMDPSTTSSQSESDDTLSSAPLSAALMKQKLTVSLLVLRSSVKPLLTA